MIESSSRSVERDLSIALIKSVLNESTVKRNREDHVVTANIRSKGQDETISVLVLSLHIARLHTLGLDSDG